jgi:glycosyltransferase involved in cell wall biosynthesis
VSPSVVGGGAEKVAADLHSSYLGRGIGSWLAVANVNAESPGTVQIPLDARRNPWARALLGAARRPTLARPLTRTLRMAAQPRRFGRVAAGYEDFDFPGTVDLLALPPEVPEVLQLHNLHGSYFDIRALPRLAEQIATVYTLHDTWTLTGHCAYPLECQRWHNGCGACPDLTRYVPLRADRSAENAAVKRSAVGASGLCVVTPSEWLGGMVEESGILGAAGRLEVIPNGVDTSVMHPGDRGAERQRLGLATDRTVVLFAARALAASVYKGFDTLASALGILGEHGQSRELLMIGLGEEGVGSRRGGIEMRFLPFTADPEVIASYYRAADVYVHPARGETFGLAILEAMACGIPVIASDVGGIPELVEDGCTGILVPTDDPTALAEAIAGLIEDSETRRRMAGASTTRATERFTLELQVDRYLALYRELIEERR